LIHWIDFLTPFYLKKVSRPARFSLFNYLAVAAGIIWNKRCQRIPIDISVISTVKLRKIIDQFVISAALSSFDWQSQKLARF
jgi:hypothetical protein